MKKIKKSFPYQFDKFKHFEYGRVEEVVSAVVGDERVDDGGEEVPLDDVAVVELVFERDDLPHEAKRALKIIKRENSIKIFKLIISYIRRGRCVWSS